MKPVFVRPASLEDTRLVAARLRPEDRDEVLAASGLDPLLALPAYVQEGREVYAAGLEFDGVPEVLFGLDPIPIEMPAACIWLLSTPRLYDFPVEFTVNSRRWFDEAHERFELLTNFVDARNTRHHGWLKWLGFTFIRRVEKFGAHSLPFIEFASYRPKCA